MAQETAIVLDMSTLALAAAEAMVALQRFHGGNAPLPNITHHQAYT